MKRLLLLGLMIPAVLFGQKTNDLIIALQRDMSSLQEQMKTMQKEQDEKFAAIQGMLQQAVDSSGRSASSLTALQRAVDTKLTDMQSKLVAPMANMGSKVDQLADEFRAVSTTVVDLRAKVLALDGKLADISTALRMLAAATPAPPAPAAAVTQQDPAGPPPGMSADGQWDSARRDENAGHPDLALTEYANIVKWYSDTSRAPEAQFKIGMIYFHNDQFDDAVKAFDVVLERFAENPKTQEALYYKAVSLMKSPDDHKTEAGKEFKDYLAKYAKSGEHVAAAHTNLKNLGMEPRTSPKKR
jgi:tetratricopeptide (TPR) repeat protein